MAKVFTFAWLLNASFLDGKGGIKRVKLCFKDKGITYSFKINTTETEGEKFSGNENCVDLKFLF